MEYVKQEIGGNMILTISCKEEEGLAIIKFLNEYAKLPKPIKSKTKT